jgi:hypothetical protein
MCNLVLRKDSNAATSFLISIHVKKLQFTAFDMTNMVKWWSWTGTNDRKAPFYTEPARHLFDVFMNWYHCRLSMIHGCNMNVQCGIDGAHIVYATYYSTKTPKRKISLRTIKLQRFSLREFVDRMRHNKSTQYCWSKWFLRHQHHSAKGTYAFYLRFSCTCRDVLSARQRHGLLWVTGVGFFFQWFWCWLCVFGWNIGPHNNVCHRTICEECAVFICSIFRQEDIVHRTTDGRFIYKTMDSGQINKTTQRRLQNIQDCRNMMKPGCQKTFWNALCNLFQIAQKRTTTKWMTK